MKKIYCLVFFLSSFSFTNPLFAQKKDTLIRQLDSLEKGQQKPPRFNDINEQAYNSNTKITGRVYFTLLGSDFKQQISKPFHMRGNDWLKLGVFTATTAALTLADESIQNWGQDLHENNKWVRDVGSVVTRFGGVTEAFVLAGIGGYGAIIKNTKLKTTALLATHSYITSAATSALLKQIFGRQRPEFSTPNSIESEPIFHGPFFGGGKNADGKRLNTAFPSGHATAAFSAATVFAMEYRNKRLVPVIAYTAASLIAISRVTENKHWFTDVFAGAILGYLSGRQVANNYHRYAKLKSEEEKNKVSFNFQINNGVLIPGFVYRF